MDRRPGALPLIRVAATTCGQTWSHFRDKAQRLHAVTFTGSAGTFRQSTELTKTQHDPFDALSIDPPKRILDITTTNR